MNQNLRLNKDKTLTEEDKKVLAKYGIVPKETKEGFEDLTKEEAIESWLGQWSYICYIVENNTNLTIDKETNLVKVRDRYNSHIYGLELQKEHRDKEELKSKRKRK